MFRTLASLALLALLLYSCGPDSRRCSGQDPEFVIVLKLTNRPLPPDTVVHVTYAGSGAEDFRLSDPKALTEVTFCRIADKSGEPLKPSATESMGGTSADGAAGAAGASDTASASGASGAPGTENPAEGVEALYCTFYTGGFAQITVSGTGFETAKFDLAPKDGECTVYEPTFVLDSPDAG